MALHKKSGRMKKCVGVLDRVGPTCTVAHMDDVTIRRLNEEHRQTRRGVRLKAVKVRLPESIRVRLLAAAAARGITQTEYVVAGLALVLPPETV